MKSQLMTPQTIDTAGVCKLRGLNVCRREHYALTFIFETSRYEWISICLHCNSHGFIPLAPEPAIKFFDHP